MDETLSLIQALNYRRISSDTFYNLIRLGELRVFQVLGRRLLQSLSFAFRPGVYALEGLPDLGRQARR
jgi:hypothetical protein